MNDSDNDNRKKSHSRSTMIDIKNKKKTNSYLTIALETTIKERMKVPSQSCIRKMDSPGARRRMASLKLHGLTQHSATILFNSLSQRRISSRHSDDEYSR